MWSAYPESSGVRYHYCTKLLRDPWFFSNISRLLNCVQYFVLSLFSGTTCISSIFHAHTCRIFPLRSGCRAETRSRALGTLSLSKVDVKTEMRPNVSYNSIKIETMNQNEYFAGPYEEDTNLKFKIVEYR